MEKFKEVKELSRQAEERLVPAEETNGETNHNGSASAGVGEVKVAPEILHNSVPLKRPNTPNSTHVRTFTGV